MFVLAAVGALEELNALNVLTATQQLVIQMGILVDAWEEFVPEGVNLAQFTEVLHIDNVVHVFVTLTTGR